MMWPPTPQVITADDVVSEGACREGLREWLLEQDEPPTALPVADAMSGAPPHGLEHVKAAVGACGSGSGYGYGDGSGSGYGHGSGYGYGYGFGYGGGYGDGYGDGDGSGSGSGSGYS